MEGTTIRDGSTSGWGGSATGWVESTIGWQGSATRWVGNSAGGEGWGAKGTRASMMACTAKLCCWGGRVSYSRGPLKAGEQRVQDGWEGCLEQCSRGQMPAAGWAAKQGANGEEGGRGVPLEGGWQQGGATLGAVCGVDSSSMGQLAGGAAAGAGNGRVVAVPWGSSWQAAIASLS